MSNERTVAIGGLEHDKAVDTLGGSKDILLGEDAVPDFKKVECYSFIAEWALVGPDIQVKFFLPKHAQLDTPEARQAWMDYWLKRFTKVIDRVARQYFEADRPRLIVKWTEEYNSWWFCARRYDYLLDLAAFLLPFFDQLDAALRQKEDDSETLHETGGV